jgi:hypothetical protein
VSSGAAKLRRCAAPMFRWSDGSRSKKLRESAAKLLKSFASVNLCARRKNPGQLARQAGAPYGKVELYFDDAREATRSRAPGAPAVTARA